MTDLSGRDARAEVLANPLWYHTMELAPGIVTPGWFDLRPVVEQMPWPDVRGLRCLDVGPYDGFLSFELERRGAAEVTAVDIGDHTEWDWPVDMRPRAREFEALAGPEVGAGFRIAKRLLGSSVKRMVLSVYELSPERVGTFDVIVCGSLLLHLRDPLRALEAIRSVCSGHFLSAEAIDLRLAVMHRKEPTARLNGLGTRCQWWIPNPAGHRRMLMAAGFQLEQTTRPYAIPMGSGHPAAAGSWRNAPRRFATRVLAGRSGVPHAAVLARPSH